MIVHSLVHDRVKGVEEVDHLHGGARLRHEAEVHHGTGFKCRSYFIEANGDFWPGAPVLWLWEETHVLKVVSSNPSTVYWMDINLL